MGIVIKISLNITWLILKSHLEDFQKKIILEHDSFPDLSLVRKRKFVMKK